MNYPDTFTVSTPSDREIQVTRDFDAPRPMVFEAFTKPELVRRWLLGPPGWIMPQCEVDLRVGGAYRYVWRFEKTDPRWAFAVCSMKSRSSIVSPPPRSSTPLGTREKL